MALADPLEVPGVALAPEPLLRLRRLALERDAPSETAPAAIPGGFISRRRGQGQEIADTREYVAGDDIRHLDRGSTARTGVLHIRRFQEERDRVCFLVLDLRPSMLWGTGRALRSVAAAEALALIGWRAVEEGGRVGLMAFGAPGPAEIRGARGRTRGMLEVIGGMVREHRRALAAAASGRAGEEMPLEAALAPLARLAPRGAELVIASGLDTPGEGLRAVLGELAEKRQPQLVVVEDRGAGQLPAGRYPIRTRLGRRLMRPAPREAEQPAPPVEGLPAVTVEAAGPVAGMAARLRAARGL